MGYHQAKWCEPTLFELDTKDRRGFTLPPLRDQSLEKSVNNDKWIPAQFMREHELTLPSISEIGVVRHFIRLSQMSFGVDCGACLLGSCTMKYNPKMNEIVASSDKIRMLHPNQDSSTVQGALEIMYKLSHWIAEITGTHSVSLQPSAGAQGELTGTLIIRAHHKNNGDLQRRNEIIIPDAAHGTNPASAAMAGFRTIIVPTGDDGCIDVESLKTAISHRTAGLMLTNPNTLGIFEENVLEISKIIHDVGGLMYYDGANLNAIMGKTRPGDMGFDIVHVNLHKTFSTPHGGGGPGSGPVGVKEELDKFLPLPLVEFNGKTYHLDYDRPFSIGRVRCFYGNFSVLLRAYAYIRFMGAAGLEKVSESSVLNANYLASKISSIKGFDLEFGAGKPRKHEFVISCFHLKRKTGIGAGEVAKRLMDFGVHAPTVYFPSIVEEALMIEPTESESVEELDRIVDLFTQISEEAHNNPKIVLEAPHNTTIRSLDEVKASHPRTLYLSWRMFWKQSSMESQLP